MRVHLIHVVGGRTVLLTVRLGRWEMLAWLAKKRKAGVRRFHIHRVGQGA